MNNRERESSTSQLGPVVISGVGGSGTRVFAEIMSKVGYYIGDDLNRALDNFWFSLLLKRPRWIIKNWENDEVIEKAIETFTKIMCNDEKLSKNDYKIILSATLEWAIKGNHFGGIGGTGRGVWPFFRLKSILNRVRTKECLNQSWGWKEPNSHIYLKYLDKLFPNLKYIHIVRHGLDMAYSANLTQLHNWGILYDIDFDKRLLPLPVYALKYWIKANDVAVTYSNKNLGDRFKLVKFESFCLNPKEEIKDFLQFLGKSVDEEKFSELVSLPSLPKSTGRYKSKDLKVFAKNDLDIVQNYGYSI